MFLVKWTFIGVILLPLAEIVAFVAVAMTIGWFPTLFLFVATSVAGVLVLKRAGRSDLDRFREAVGADGIRTIHLDTPGLAPILAGILLVLPGFITDLAGVLLLLPPVRRWASATLGRALRRRRAAREPSVIDLAPNEWRHVSDRIEDGRKRKPSGPRRRGRENTLS